MRIRHIGQTSTDCGKGVKNPPLSIMRAIQNGLLISARQVPSPNCDERPDSEISLLVVHNISLPPGEFGGTYIDALFTNTLDASAHAFFKQIAGIRVSAHVLIRRDGETVQYVPFHKRAWHAGKSVFDGREACNDFSIGIELEGTDDTPYAATQYKALAQTSALLMREYPAITPARICGHSDIAPGRKTDPGRAFEWGKYRALLEQTGTNSNN